MYNALFLVRVFSKHFAGNLSGDEIRSQFDGAYVPTVENSSAFIPAVILNKESLVQGILRLTIDPVVDTDPNSKSSQLLDALLDIIVKIYPE